MRRALVVEPSQDLRALVSAALRAQDFAVEELSDPDELDRADARKYAIVLADVPFGESSGEFVAKHPAFESRLLLMSADRDDERPAEAPLLLKPFDRRDLMRAVSDRLKV